MATIAAIGGTLIFNNANTVDGFTTVAGGSSLTFNNSGPGCTRATPSPLLRLV